ncbi:MAG: restriction endonuclease subunit S [Nostoc sp.]
MLHDWLELSLGDVITLQRGFDLPNRERIPGNVPVVSSSGISGIHSEAKVSAPGVVTGRYGTIGQVFYIKEDYWPLNTTLFVKDFKGNDPLFVSFLLRTIDFLSCSDKSSVPGLNRNDLHLIKVKLPPLSEQKAIAHILGTLDDKIELNREMNQTLEAMARAIFKSWFVDFDPVRAKMEGRQPAGMDAATAELFPDEFEESALGMIPKGWRIGKLDDLLILQRGFDLPASQRIPGNYPVIAASGASGTHAEYKVTGPGVTTGRSGLLGKVFFVHEDFWPLNTSLWVKEFKNSRPIHAYHLLSELKFETFNAGSAVPTLNRNHVHSLPEIIPPISIVEAFEDLVISMFRKCRANEKQSVTLTSIRDTLLPKLLSGEIRVKEAEKIAAKAM